MKKRDPLKQLSRIAHDVLISLIGGFVVHGIKLLVPVIVLWLSVLFDQPINSSPPFHQYHATVMDARIADTG